MDVDLKHTFDHWKCEGDCPICHPMQDAGVIDAAPWVDVLLDDAEEPTDGESLGWLCSTLFLEFLME